MNSISSNGIKTNIFIIFDKIFGIIIDIPIEIHRIYFTTIRLLSLLYRICILYQSVKYVTELEHAKSFEFSIVLEGSLFRRQQISKIYM